MKIIRSLWRHAMQAAALAGLAKGAAGAVRQTGAAEEQGRASAATDRAPPGPPSTAARKTPTSVAAKRAGWRGFYEAMRDAIKAWSDDYAPSMGAALSYYTVFSIAPLLLIVISVAGLVFGADAARGQVTAQLSGFLGEEGGVAIEGLLKSASLDNKGIVGTVVGALLLVVGATTVFAELQSALDRIWHAPERVRPSGILGMLRARLLSFGLVLALGFLMLVSLLASAGLWALGEWWAPVFGAWEILLQAVNFLLSFALVTVVFAMIYKFMPSVRIAWGDVWIGAGVTAALFTIGKFLIGLYIGKSGVASGFGAASSIVLLLLWVYYSAQIYLVGAEFTWVWAHRFGSKKGEEDAASAP